MFILKNAGIECAARGLQQGKIAFRSVVDFFTEDAYLYYDGEWVCRHHHEGLMEFNNKYTFTQQDVFATDWIIADKEITIHKEKFNE